MATFPVLLTNKEWQKNKGLFAKAKPTGIGEQLTALEKAYKASAFGLDPAEMGAETTDPLLFEKKLATLVRTLGAHAAKIDVIAVEADRRITTAQRTFAKDKAITTYLDKVDKELTAFRAGLQPGGAIAKAMQEAVVQAYKQRLAKTSAAVHLKSGVVAKSEKGWREIMAQIKELEARPTADMVHTLWSNDGPHRLMTTNAKMWDQLFARDFPELTKSIYAGKAMQDYAALPWMMDVANENMSNASKKVTSLIGNATEERVVHRMALEYSNSLLKFHELIDHFSAAYKALKKYL